MPSIPSPHTGLFREENAVLRYLFGYALEYFGPYTPPFTLDSLRNSDMKDFLLVAADVSPFPDHTVDHPHINVGISTLDLRTLKSLIETGVVDWNDCLHEVLVSTYQFTVDDSIPPRSPAQDFLFGEAENTTQSDFNSAVTALTRGRPYIVVTHGGIPVDVLAGLTTLFSNAKYHIDINKVAQYVLQLYYRYSLPKILDDVKLDRLDNSRHTARGNNANFILMAILKLVVKDGKEHQNEKPQNTIPTILLLRHLHSIASTPRPLCSEELRPRAEKVEKLGLRAKGRLKRQRRRAREEEAEIAMQASLYETYGG